MTLWLAGVALAQGLEEQLDSKRAALEQAREQEGVLTGSIARYSEQIDRLIGEVAVLRNREAIVQQRLIAVEQRLEAEREHLQRVRRQLRRSMRVLRARLVDIYKSDQPDALTVILNADGFDDLLSRYEYLTSIQEQDAEIVGRVRDLRAEVKLSVESLRSARDEIAARRAELARTRAQLELREADLSAARARMQDALGEVENKVEILEGDVSDLQDEIAAQLRAAQEAAAADASSGAVGVPAGPVQGESSSGLIWPVNGTLTSPFGPRWGRTHEGIDIAAPEGTPIRAAAGGNVVMASYNGGYGNYTCIDHGGALSTCYAHQSSIGVSSGQSVGQGDVIGAVGNTGASFGAHVHFEVRVNGQAVDPMGYL